MWICTVKRVELGQELEGPLENASSPSPDEFQQQFSQGYDVGRIQGSDKGGVKLY